MREFQGAGAPRLFHVRTRPKAELIRAARGWALTLLTVPIALTLAALAADGPQTWLSLTLAAGRLRAG